MWSLGYTVRREALDEDYSAGIENIAVDSQAGIGSPMFLRTVKLKDFPWNGWLAMGVDGGARAAWNPVAGFTDPAGRLVWAAVGDPALLLDPDNGRFIPNRARLQGIEDAGEVPTDALVPAGGALKPAGAGVTARTKLVYRVLLSNTPRRAEDERSRSALSLRACDALERQRRSRVRPRDRARDGCHAREGGRGPDRPRGHAGP